MRTTREQAAEISGDGAFTDAARQLARDYLAALRVVDAFRVYGKIGDQWAAGEFVEDATHLIAYGRVRNALAAFGAEQGEHG